MSPKPCHVPVLCWARPGLQARLFCLLHFQIPETVGPQIFYPFSGTDPLHFTIIFFLLATLWLRPPADGWHHPPPLLPPHEQPPRRLSAAPKFAAAFIMTLTDPATCSPYVHRASVAPFTFQLNTVLGWITLTTLAVLLPGHFGTAFGPMHHRPIAPSCCRWHSKDDISQGGTVIVGIVCALGRLLSFTIIGPLLAGRQLGVLLRGRRKHERDSRSRSAEYEGHFSRGSRAGEGCYGHPSCASRATGVCRASD